ncbi:MAG: cold shock domain-containing protein [Proteobacteria bacterium]|uniref:cold shock domain-containing protein n=1 Tax=Rudaea sp. TaxID=2136325 RepID=UPI00322060CC|nr:cold shock domain-containing protein [Pseudomonadota bacterium]
MRIHGTLARWNDERGFGFIAPAGGGDELFVHVSAFPRDGVRPRVGELISFETETRADGKKRAARVMRPTVRAPRSAPPAAARTRTSFVRAAALAAVASLGAYAFLSSSNPPRPEPPARTPTLETKTRAGTASPALLQTPAEAFSCDGRTHCSQMTSCKEAKFFLKNCPNVEMDGDGDGVPCEKQWCG